MSLTVLHVLEAVAHGTGRHLVDLVTHLPDIAHHAVLPERPTSRGESDVHATARALDAAGATVHLVPMRRSPLHPDLVRAVRRARVLASDTRPDVVHGHATVGGVVARLAAVGTGVPCIYTPNGLHPSAVVRAAERVLAPLTDRLIAVSRSEAGAAARSGLADERRIVVVENGIDVDAQPDPPLDLRTTLGLTAETQLVGFVGRLARQKAPDVLVSALAVLPSDVHGVLVGDGPWRGRIEEQVRAERVDDRIHLVGHVEDAAGLLPQFDVLALPSRWEGGPYVPLEAFRAGVPVVVADADGARDTVRDGVTGLVVPVDDIASLATALGRLLGDNELAASCVQAARRDLNERFDVRLMSERTARQYHHVARGTQHAL